MTTNKTLDIDADPAGIAARRKALDAQEAAMQSRQRNQLGDLVLVTGIAKVRTPENLVGSWLWSLEQRRANPGLEKEWDRLGAAFLGTHRRGRDCARHSRDADPKPADTAGRDHRPDAGPADLLARVAAQ